MFSSGAIETRGRKKALKNAQITRLLEARQKLQRKHNPKREIQVFKLVQGPTLASRPARQAGSQPSSQPSNQPSSQPARHPARQPGSQPARQAGSQAGSQPVSQATIQLGRQPAGQPEPRSRTLVGFLWYLYGTCMVLVWYLYVFLWYLLVLVMNKRSL